MKNTLPFLFVALIVTIGSAYAQNTDSACHGAGGCYVATTGNDLTGNGTIGSPWLTIVKCFNEVHAGDTCWLRGGDYEAPDTGTCVEYTPWGDDYGWCFGGLQRTEYSATRQGTGGTAGNPVVISGYPGETARLTQDRCDKNLITFSVQTNTYITFQDLTFFSGRTREAGDNTTDGIVFERNIIHLNPSGTRQAGGIENISMFMSGSNAVPFIDGWVFRNNLFISDNGDTAPNVSNNPSAGECQFTGGQQQMFTDFYALNGAIFEHNDFIVTADSTNPGGGTGIGNALGFKASCANSVIQNNYFAHLSSSGFTERAFWSGNSDPDDANPNVGSNTFRYNIIDRMGHIHSHMSAHDDLIYNNTIYNPRSECWETSGAIPPRTVHSNSFFNNVCVVSSGVQYLDFGGDSPTTASIVNIQSYLDHNIYWKVEGSGTRQWREDGTIISDATNSISAWQTHMSGYGGAIALFDDNSRVVDPGLTNPAAGNYSLTIGAAARTGGRDTPYPTWLGADDPNSTTDYFGCTFDSRCHSYAFAAAPTGSSVRGAVIRGGVVR